MTRSVRPAMYVAHTPMKKTGPEEALLPTAGPGPMIDPVSNYLIPSLSPLPFPLPAPLRPSSLVAAPLRSSDPSAGGPPTHRRARRTKWKQHHALAPSLRLPPP
jgi:hypothetical protein